MSNIKEKILSKFLLWDLIICSPLDGKEIQPVHSKGDQPWVFFGRTDAKAETPVLWPPHAKSWLIGKDSDAGWDWRQEEKGTTEDEMAGWYHRLDGHKFEWTPGVGDRQGGLACCSSWGHKDLDTTERLNWTELNRGLDVINPKSKLVMVFGMWLHWKDAFSADAELYWTRLRSGLGLTHQPYVTFP